MRVGNFEAELKDLRSETRTGQQGNHGVTTQQYIAEIQQKIRHLKTDIAFTFQKLHGMI